MRKNLLFISLIWLAACSEQTPGESNEAPPVQQDVVTLTGSQLKNAGVRTGTAIQKPLSKVVRASGKVEVEPQNLVSVSFPMGGYLKSMNLVPGMRVKTGAVLAVLEDMQYVQMQQDYLSGKIRLAYLEAEFERQQALSAGKATSDKVFRQVKSEYDMQKVLVKSLDEKLEMIGISPASLTEATISRSVSLRSPITGFVSRVNVNNGKYVNPSDVLFELTDPRNLHLVVTVFQQDIGLMKEGQPFTATVAGDAGKKYKGEVALVNRDISSGGSALLHCHFEKPDELVPGMYMNAAIEVNNASAVVVPEAAVVRYENRQYVFLAEGNNRFRITPVDTGVAGEGTVEITSGNREQLLKSTIVLSNAYALLMKMKNTPEEE